MEYEMGNQFALDMEAAKANSACIFKGSKYRISVLTERLIRLEYNEAGVFCDNPTQLVWNRKFEKPEFEVDERGNTLIITTKYYKLTYIKETPFIGNQVNKGGNLKIELLNTDKTWYYGHPEVRNYKAPSSLDNLKADTVKGLYSIDGFSTIDDSDHNLLNSKGNVIKRDKKGIDLYVFMYLKDFSLCLKDYFTLTGYPALLPRYALGNWWSRNDDYSDTRVEDLIANFEFNDIPLSILMLDKDWHIRLKEKNAHLKTGFTFNAEYFKDPAKTVEFLHSKGIRLGLNVNPTEGFYPIDTYYEQAKKYLPANEKGIIPFNVFDAKTIDVYLKIFIHPLDNYGIDFFWLDWYDSKKLDELSLLKHYHFYDMMRNYQRRPMVFAYSSDIAPHRYPVLYAGKTTVSWETLASIPLFNSSATNMGVSWWSHDIGGNHGGIEDGELYLRYVQLGTFSPILKLGADKSKYYKREPWRWNLSQKEIIKKYFNLRYKLIPYIYTESYIYSKNYG